MKTFIVLLLSCAVVFGAETLIPLKSGESERIVSYSLFCLATDIRDASNRPPDADLILTLRNIGTKFIDVDGVTVTNFSLRDANKNEMKIYLGTHPNGMAYGEANVFHLRVYGADAPQPWTLHFDSGPKAFVPIELTIADIKPRKK